MVQKIAMLLGHRRRRSRNERARARVAKGTGACTIPSSGNDAGPAKLRVSARKGVRLSKSRADASQRRTRQPCCPNFSQRSSEGGDLHAQMGLITMIKRTILAFAISFLLAAGLNSMVSAQEATPDASPIATETSVPTETVAPELPETGVGTSQDNNSTLLLLGFVAAVGLVGVTGYTAYRRSSR